VQTIHLTADSLVVGLYGNGYVDGDSVSLILNGKLLMQHSLLSQRSATKTIRVTPEMGDSLNLVMYAENLGSIAPNSGLAVIHDGEKRYQVAFTGDLQKNAAIILKKRKKIN